MATSITAEAIRSFLMMNDGLNFLKLIRNPNILKNPSFDNIRNSPYLKEFLEDQLQQHNITPTTNSIYQLLRDLQQIDFAKSVKTSYKNFDSNEHFKGFTAKPGHISVTGTTGAGKTTVLELLIAKGTIKVPKKIFIYMSSFGKKKFEDEMQPILTYQYMKQNNANEPPEIYVFIDSINEMMKAVEHLKQSSGDYDKEEILFIFDDVRGIKNAVKNVIAPFLYLAKNINCRVIYIDHNPTVDKKAMDSLSYSIMCNPSVEAFNGVVHSSQEKKVIDQRYVTLQQQINKCMIFDKSNEQCYWAFANMPMLKAI
jgi:hypothetical protein